MVPITLLDIEKQLELLVLPLKMLSSSVLFRGAAMLKVVIPFMCLLIVYVISRDSSLPSRLSLLRMSNSIVNEKTYTANSIHRNTAYTANSISMNKTYTANSISRTPSSNKTDMIIHFKNQNYTNIIQDVNSTNMTFTGECMVALFCFILLFISKIA